MDFWISDWISIGFTVDFTVDFWISVCISADGVRDFFRDGPLDGTESRQVNWTRRSSVQIPCEVNFHLELAIVLQVVALYFIVAL